MGKLCKYPDCNTEINEWQEYCVDHYIKVNTEGLPEQQGEKMEETEKVTPQAEQLRQDSFQNIQQPKPTVQEVKQVQDTSTMPQLSQEQIKMILQKEQMKLQQQAQKRVQQQPKPAPAQASVKQQPTVTKTKTKIPVKSRTDFAIPDKITEQQRLTIKMYALQSAVQMLSNMGYDNNFKTMIEDVRALTAHFFNIVIEKNEQV